MSFFGDNIRHTFVPYFSVLLSCVRPKQLRWPRTSRARLVCRFAGNYGVEAFLELLSEDNYDAFCLAYMFTYRDFDGGTLGLAWTGDVNNAGGVCERNGVRNRHAFHDRYS